MTPREWAHHHAEDQRRLHDRREENRIRFSTTDILPMTTDALQQFIKDAETFDWFYQMSDDHSVWQRGCTAEAVILNRAVAGGDEFKRAWNEAYAKRYNTPTFCGPFKAPFPDVWPADAKDNTSK